MNSDQCYLRPVKQQDAEILYKWATSPEVRANAINQKGFSYEHHLKWLEGKLADPECFFFMLEYNKIVIGQIRIDKHENEWIIDYSVDSTWRGRGFGKKIIELGIQELEGRRITLVAKVKMDNAPSYKVFQSLKFLQTQSASHENYYRFELMV